MPTSGQLLGVAAAAAGLYAFYSHQQNKNALDKASDRWEKAKADISSSSNIDRSLGDDMKDSVKSSYYDMKTRAQQR